MLAQAIAREIGATFYSSSGASFTELFVGVGASRVRTLFQNARKQKPAVIFIDEVDALAGKRKTHGGEETEKTLTELLVQLDGGNNNDGVLFIAATNRKDMLDDAFLDQVGAILLSKSLCLIPQEEEKYRHPYKGLTVCR